MSDRDSVTVAIVGAGEMGAAVGRRLRESGARVVTSLAGAARTASRAFVVPASRWSTTTIRWCAMRASCFRSFRPASPSKSPNVFAVQSAARKNPRSLSNATRFRQRLAGASANCSTPRTFIDAGIIGGPPVAGTQDPAKGPRFYASGRDAYLLTRLASFGLDIAILDGPVGAASGLKLSYAGLTKGFTALCATMLGAAEREGLTDALRAELARSQPNLPQASGSLRSRDASEGVPICRRDAADRGVRRQSR